MDSLKIQDIIIWILFILAIVVFLWFLFGDSPSFEQTILVLAMTLLFTLGTKAIKNEVRIDSLERRFGKIEESFIRLISDFKDMKKRSK